MQLKVKRDQRKSMMGATVFSLTFRGEFTQEEADLIKRYGLGKDELYTSEARMANAIKTTLYSAASNVATPFGALNTGRAILSGIKTAISLKLTVNDLINGKTIENKDLASLLDVESQVLEAANNMHLFLEALKAMDGREVIYDIPLP